MIATVNHFRAKTLLTSILIFILVFASCWYALSRYESLLKEQQQLSLEKNLSLKAATLAQVIDHRFALLYGVRAFILTHFEQLESTGHSFDPAFINLFLEEIHKTVPDIRSVVISPGGIHQYIYPLNEKTRKTLGHNLLTDKRPHVRKKVQQTIESGQIGLSGPYPLRQDGSLGLIARLPIYQNDQFWGFAAMVLNVPRMLEAGGITATDGIALRTTGGKVFYGDPDAFEGQPLIISIPLPDGQWDFSIASKTPGLTTNVKAFLFILAVFLAFFASALFFSLYTRRWYLHLEVEKATRTLKKQDVLLRENESRYRSLFQDSHSIMLLVDPVTGSIIDANLAAYNYYGYDRDILLKMKITDINQLSEQQVFEEMDRAKKEKREYFMFKHRLANGDIRDVEVYSGPIQIQEKQLLYSIVYDITERKLTEKALHKSESKLASILRSAPIGIGQVTDREIIFVNDQFARMLGYSAQELTGKKSRIVYASDEEFERVGRYKYVEIKRTGTGSIETILQKKDGTLIDVFLSSTAVDKNDLSKGVTFTTLDITKRKEADAVLRAAAHEWRLIMDEFEDIIYLLDNNRHLLRANLAFYKATGTTPERSIGCHIAKLIHPQGEEDPCPICLAQEEKRDLVMVMEADDENNPAGRPIEIKVKIVRDEEGTSTGILMTLHDLTQTRLTEQILRDSEQKYRLLADYTYDWEYWLDPEGNYIYVSPSCERTTGYRPDEFISNPKLIFDLVSPDYMEAVHQHYTDENKDKIPLYTMEFPIRTKAGEERWLEHHCSPVFDAQGNYAGRRGNNRDITERKQADQERLNLEAQLRQKYKMDSVGVMAGGMAHNFNNNLSIILGNVELSKMKMASNPEIDGYLSNAKIAVLRSRDLIHQILTYSRQDIKDKTSIQLPLVIDETLQLLRSTFPATMSLQQRLSGDSHDLVINADSSQIQECLINLCNNAMHAMEEEGELTIALDSVELQQQDIPAQYESRPGRYAKLSVQDNGSGMTAETVDKIFDLFYTTKPVDEGTGVGLSTVQGIVTQHGGLIKVNSRLDEGTTFDLYFPVIEQTYAPKTIPVSEDLPRGTEHILFVDDDPMLASLGEQMLKIKGYTVSTKTDSTEALELFSTQPTQFDMVITDQTMPNLTGVELIYKLKEIRADIPTIICTGFSSKVDENTAKELGASAFLMKPLDMPKLLQTVRQVLDGGKEK